MGYIITDGDRFLSAYYEISPIPYVWRTQKAAQNYLYAWKKSKYYLNDEAVFKVCELDFDTKYDQINKNNNIAFDPQYSISDEDSFALVQQIGEQIERFNYRQMQLIYQKNALERELIDFRHYIEFSPDLDQANVYELYQYYKSILLERRKCKDELEYHIDTTYRGWNNASNNAALLAQRLSTRKCRAQSEGRIKELLESLFEEKTIEEQDKTMPADIEPDISPVTSAVSSEK